MMESLSAVLEPDVVPPAIAGAKADIQEKPAERTFREKPKESLRVLLVDDDPIDLRLNRALLEREGIDVVALSDWGKVNEELFGTGPGVQLAFIDVLMPEVRGDFLVRMMKETPRGRQLPWIIISSLPESTLSQKARFCGADGWIQKPLTGESIREIVKRFFPEE